MDQAARHTDVGITHQKFQREHPLLHKLPELIVGANNKPVRLLDVSLEDLKAYMAFLTRRIERHERWLKRKAEQW
jgi:hypothetical protein